MSVIDELQKDLQERGSDYGPFHVNSVVFSALNSEMMTALQHNTSFSRLSHNKRTLIEHGIAMISTKLARLVTGDPEHHDSWKDIAGYVNIIDRDLAALSNAEGTKK